MLSDREHVEAVAIMRRMKELFEELRGPRADPLAVLDAPVTEALIAADVWLQENHPKPGVYIAAVAAVATRSDFDGKDTQ